MTSSVINCPLKKCNLRFIDQEGLEEKIVMQSKPWEKESKRESQIKDTETIELVDEDHLDLMEIIKFSNISVSTNLKLLWEQQMKQLSMKSSNGYRWDLRSFFCLLNVWNFSWHPCSSKFTVFIIQWFMIYFLEWYDSS